MKVVPLHSFEPWLRRYLLVSCTLRFDLSEAEKEYRKFLLSTWRYVAPAKQGFDVKMTGKLVEITDREPQHPDDDVGVEVTRKALEFTDIGKQVRVLLVEQASFHSRVRINVPNDRTNYDVFLVDFDPHVWKNAMVLMWLNKKRRRNFPVQKDVAKSIVQLMIFLRFQNV